MVQPTNITTQVTASTQPQYGDALQLVFRDVPDPARTLMIDGMLEADLRGEESLDGLFVASGNGRLLGAIWAQSHPGQTAVLWPPRVANDGEALILDALIAHALDYLLAEGVTMVQSLLRTSDTDDATRLEASGFWNLTDLAYLSAQIDNSLLPPKTSLNFEPYRDDQQSRLGPLIERTYIESLDCPDLDGVREANDIIAGYRATGVFDPSRWFFVQHAGRDIGVLLLTDHPTARQWELVYMGLIPTARGNGWGEVITRYALWLASQNGADRVVLAVDGANGPAGKVYERVGFVSWDRRTVWLRKFEENIANAN